MIQHLSFTFFYNFATQLFSTPVRHHTSTTKLKLRSLRSSAFYRQPKQLPHNNFEK